jgi:hypothetical protein
MKQTSHRFGRVDRRLWMAGGGWVGLFVFLALLAPAVALAGGYGTPGNLLIADQLNNRVIELNGSGRIVWHFGTGEPVAGPHTIVAPQTVERIAPNRTLILCGSVPPGTPGYPPEGVIDNRVLVVNRYGRIVWQYGRAGVAGSGPGQLDHPTDAVWLPGIENTFLIVDQGNQRVIEVNAKKRIVWQYGTTGVAGSAANQLNHPAGVGLSWQGEEPRYLIADQGNDRVIEVTRGKRITWSYGGPQGSPLSEPTAVRRQPSGRLLVVDSGNARILRVSRAKQVTWSYVTASRPGSVAQPAPADALRRDDGDTVISDGLNQQVIEVAHDAMMVWSYGTLALPGIQWGQLDSPRGINLVPSVYVMGLPLRVHGSG